MGIPPLKHKTITHNKSTYYEYHYRRRPSCFKKGVFCTQEGHVLKQRRAFSFIILGLCSNGEGNDYRKLLTISSYTFSLSSSFISSRIGMFQRFSHRATLAFDSRGKGTLQSVQARDSTEITVNISESALPSLYVYRPS